MATATDPGSHYSRGFCTHFVQLGVLCALEVVAGSCLWWARSEDFAILHQPKGRVLTWVSSSLSKLLIPKSGSLTHLFFLYDSTWVQNKELVAKGDKAQTQKLLSSEPSLHAMGCFFSS